MNEANHQVAASSTEEQEPTEPQDQTEGQAEDQAEEKTETVEVKVFNDVEKRKNDERNYRGVILKNGLRVMLISDPKTTLSAVSLDVGVGNWSDPPNLQGLAHYLEHMLFLGNEKVKSICSSIFGHLILTANLLISLISTQIQTNTATSFKATVEFRMPSPKRPTPTSILRSNLRIWSQLWTGRSLNSLDLKRTSRMNLDNLGHYFRTDSHSSSFRHRSMRSTWRRN